MVTYLGFFGTTRLNQSRPLGCGKYCIAESQWVEPVDKRQMQIVRPLAQQPWGKVCNRLCRLSCQVDVGEVELFEEGEAGKEEERGKSFSFENFSRWLSVRPEAWFRGEAVEMPVQIITRFLQYQHFQEGDYHDVTAMQERSLKKFSSYRLYISFQGSQSGLLIDQIECRM